jgi:hypothetical protein
MSTINKRLWRLAAAIHAEFEAHGVRRRLIELPTSTWDRCASLVRRIRRSELRGWHLAAYGLSMELRYVLPSVESQLASIASDLPSRTAHETAAKTSDIYRDLVALTDEFEEVNYDRHAGWLSVTTEPLELESMFLGPFEIRLDWRKDELTYRVIATDPQTPPSRGNVTHPHVMDDILCEGDGRHSIRQALAQGRLLDFFTLVAGILRTYNPESPYVELALWYGQTCSDCGSVVHDDECFACQRCGSMLCEECERSCCGCENSCCTECTSVCPTCDESFCRRCLRQCQDCRAGVCSSCLDDHERCPKCHEERDEKETDDIAPSPDDAALQPHCLGQASLLA